MAVWLFLLLVVLDQAAYSFSGVSTPAVSESPGTPSSRTEEETSASRAPHGETGPTASEAPPTEETPSASRTPPSSSSPPPPRATESTAGEGSNTTTAAPHTTPLGSSTSREAEFSSPNSTAAAEPSEEDAPISQKPGLVAIICIFLVILLIGASVVLVKCYRGREPAFQKLDEVPMQGKVTEGSPFAHFPPK